MMRSGLAVVVTFVLFAGAFALHVVGGATDQGWLFAVAVALIYIVAAGFPAIATILTGQLNLVTGGVGGLIGLGLISGALWAANGREWAWWTVPFAGILLALTSSALLWTWRARRGRGAAVSSRRRVA